MKEIEANEEKWQIEGEESTRKRSRLKNYVYGENEERNKKDKMETRQGKQESNRKFYRRVTELRLWPLECLIHHHSGFPHVFEQLAGDSSHWIAPSHVDPRVKRPWLLLALGMCRQF